MKASGKVRPLKGGGDSAAEEPMSPSVDVVSVASGRGLGGSAPATPTEAESATNQSATGSWSRNSLRGSKCNFLRLFLLSSLILLFHAPTKQKQKTHTKMLSCLLSIFYVSGMTHLAHSIFSGRRTRTTLLFLVVLSSGSKDEWMYYSILNGKC